MTLRRRTMRSCFLLPILAALAACGSSDPGGGSKTPALSISPTTATAVAGGAPVNFTATLSNATGTVSWALTGPGSIAPSSGTTTAYTPPATLGAANTATLTATSGALSATASISVTPPPTITVAGRVVDASRQGVAAVPVVIGSQTATTDATGAFSIPGVTAPYDLAIVVTNGARKIAQLYKGLTRADPKLLSLGSSATVTSLHGTVSGTISGGDAIPTAGVKTVVAWGSPETSQTITSTANPYTLDVAWRGPGSTTGNVHVLQVVQTGSTIPTAYDFYGTTNVTVGSGATVNGANVSLTAVTPSTVAGSIAVPAGLTISNKSLGLDFADGATVGLGTDGTPATSFSYPAPGGIGATMSVAASATAASAGTTVTRQSGIAPGATAAVVTLQAPPTLTAPANAATGVTTSTDFTWTPFAGGVNLVVFSAPGSATEYVIVSTGSTARLPDLTAQSAGLPAATTYTWQILALGPYASVDAFAAIDTLLSSVGTIQEALSLSRTFTTP